MTESDVEATLSGYALNKMCFSFNEAANRAAFLADEDAYCARYGLSEQVRAAVRNRDKRALMAAGGNPYFLIKFDRMRPSAGT